MPPLGDAQAARPLLVCLGEGSTHPAAGQEPQPSGNAGCATGDVDPRPNLHRRTLPASRSDERGDLDDSYPARATAGTAVSTSGGPARYEIRVEGVLDSGWAAWFGGLHIERDGTQTVISGSLADQSALHGLLTKIGDLGLGLISVRRLDPD